MISAPHSINPIPYIFHTRGVHVPSSIKYQKLLKAGYASTMSPFIVVEPEPFEATFRPVQSHWYTPKSFEFEGLGPPNQSLASLSLSSTTRTEGELKV